MRSVRALLLRLRFYVMILTDDVNMATPLKAMAYNSTPVVYLDGVCWTNTQVLIFCTVNITPRSMFPLQWRHSEPDCVSNHQSHDCLLNRLFRRRSKKISKLRVTGLCAGNSPGPVNFPHKGPVTRKMFPFDNVIMQDQLVLPDPALHRPPKQ